MRTWKPVLLSWAGAPYRSKERISGYAMDPLRWTVGIELIAGMSGSVLAPEGSMSCTQLLSNVLFLRTLSF